jgi:hypothetical protein
MSADTATIEHFTYFSAAKLPTGTLVRRMRDALADQDAIGVDRRFDTMVGTGLSGAVVVPVMARAMRKRWAIIRKADDGSHASGHVLEGTIGRRFLIVDDQIDSGRTVANILDGVAKAWQRYGDASVAPPVFVGTYQYCYGRFRSAEWHLTDSEWTCIGAAIRDYRAVTPRQADY